ncbi:uncharacterized protein LOC100573396 isoform X3 [Acyrthosiphon pisum]|uniref:MADF domain-containing protein n=1 Tax=Acyrthosiphon pisum TaxID=7029 RepID=A0A8R2JRW7_ACYPI|nr:uncharacterized protein LOC100573396 isoform X3 [Acyrthosiphon pisum]
MGDESRNTGTSDSSTDKQILRAFIAEYKQLPELWDVRTLKRIKKNAANEKLLTIYKGLKSNATVDGVKKIINTLKSNYRKELKKINDSKRSGAGSDDIYVPSSWVFEELSFLMNLEKPVESISSISEETVNDSDGPSEHINLKVLGQDNAVVQFKIKKNTPLKKLMNAYCERTVSRVYPSKR